MHEHLYKYLVLYRKLNIPKLGSFSIINETAHFDKATGLLFAPRPVIRFLAEEIPDPDKIFFDFLAEELGVDEVTAMKEFQDFSYQFRKNIAENHLALLPGVGRITKGAEGNIFFTAETYLNEFLPPIEPDKNFRFVHKKVPNETDIPQAEVMEENFEEEVETSGKDYWWVYAIILLVIGSGALLLYYQ